MIYVKPIDMTLQSLKYRQGTETKFEFFPTLTGARNRYIVLIQQKAKLKEDITIGDIRFAIRRIEGTTREELIASLNDLLS